MLKKLYVNNYLSLQNFTLELLSSSSLLIGDNGSGKSSVGRALGILRDIGAGETDPGRLVEMGDFSFGNTELPMRFELENTLGDDSYKYSLVLEIPKGFKKAGIREESLEYNGNPVFARKLGHIKFRPLKHNTALEFPLDRHKIGLPIIGDPEKDNHIERYRRWLASIILISPSPQSIRSSFSDGADILNWNCVNFCAWLSGRLGANPAIYTSMSESLQKIMPDFKSFAPKYDSSGEKRFEIVFKRGSTFKCGLKSLGDGEKCGMLIAAIRAYAELRAENEEETFVFWDEPDAYLSIWKTDDVIMHFIKGFSGKGQILATSHDENAIRCFTRDEIFLLSRPGHLEPTRVERIDKIMDGKEDLLDLIKFGFLDQNNGHE